MTQIEFEPPARCPHKVRVGDRHPALSCVTCALVQTADILSRVALAFPRDDNRHTDMLALGRIYRAVAIGEPPRPADLLATEVIRGAFIRGA